MQLGKRKSVRFRLHFVYWRFIPTFRRKASPRPNQLKKVFLAVVSSKCIVKLFPIESKFSLTLTKYSYSVPAAIKIAIRTK